MGGDCLLRPWKKQIGSLSLLLFPGPEKANWVSEPFCFFFARETANWKSEPALEKAWGLALSSFASTMRTFRHTCAVSHDKEFSKGREKAIGHVSDFQFAFSWAREKAKGSDFQFAFSQAGKKQNGSDFQFVFSRADFQFAFSRAGKKQNGPDFQFAFSRAWKKQTAQTSNLLFPGPGKSKMVQASNFFRAGKKPDLQFAFSRPGKKQNGSDFEFAFSQPGKKQNGSDFHFAFSRARKKQNGSAFQLMVQTSNLLFPGSGKRKMKLLPIWKAICGGGLPSPAWKQAAPGRFVLMSLAPCPLGHSFLKNLLFSGFPKATWMSNLPARLKLPICVFPGLEKAKGSDVGPGKSKLVQTSNQAILTLPCFWLGPTLHEQETAQSGQFAQTSNLLFPGPGKSKMVRTSNLLFPNPGKSNRKSEEQLFLQRGQVTNMTCADLSQDLREPFATAVRAQSKSAFEIRLLTRKRWVFERRSNDLPELVRPVRPRKGGVDEAFRLSGRKRRVTNGFTGSALGSKKGSSVIRLFYLAH